MGVIQEALEKAREQVVNEAREALAELAGKAEGKVQGALAKLQDLVDTWEQSAARLQGLGITSIAEIALAGGAVWVGKSNTGMSGTMTVTDVVERVARNCNRGHFMNVHPDQFYEVFVIVVPGKKK